MNNLIGIDARLFPRDTLPKVPAMVTPFSEIVREMSNNLSSVDIKKLYFLCLDLIPPEQQCPETIEELLSFIGDNIDHATLLKELLYHIKKYRMLKSLQTCRHKMKVTVETTSYIRQQRSALFFVCENLENDAAVQLKGLLGENFSVTEGWEEVKAEDFFRIWLREINDKKIQTLKKALNVMQRDDLAANLSHGESAYHMIIPSYRKPCGLAVIFNHELFNMPAQNCGERIPAANLLTREGTDIDEKNLINLWHSFGFDVVVFRNITYCVMLETLRCLTALDYSNYHAFICCILTHGGNGLTYTSDNIAVSVVKEVIYRFDSTAVPSLNNKPKIFLIQACQGSEPQTVSSDPSSNLQIDSVGEGNDTKLYSNNKRDLLWVTSAVPSHMSFRDPKSGSWFVNSIVDIFERMGTELPLRELLDTVNSQVAEKRGLYQHYGIVTQVCLISHTTFRVLRLKKMKNNAGPPGPIRNPAHCSLVLQPLCHIAHAIYLV